MSLRLDDVADPIQRLRVGLLGATVDAELDVNDPATASLMRARVDELHRALEGRGLELGALGLTGLSGGEAAGDAWLGARADTTAELLRTLLGVAGGNEGGRDGAERERAAQEGRSGRAGQQDDPRRRDGDGEERK